MPTSKKPVKVMDVVHPADTAPDSTSRPVVITNRPFMKVDPMLNSDAATPSAPVSDDDKPSQVAPTPPPEVAVDNQAKDITPPEVDLKPAEPEESGVTVPAEEPKAEPELQPESEAKDESETPPAPDEAAQTEEANPEAESGDAGVLPGRTDEVADDTQQTEIERHIAEGTYFVQIGQTKRRRQKVAFIIILVIILAVVTVDILLDLGTISISNIPHTNFFK